MPVSLRWRLVGWRWVVGVERHQVLLAVGRGAHRILPRGRGLHSHRPQGTPKGPRAEGPRRDATTRRRPSLLTAANSRSENPLPPRPSTAGCVRGGLEPTPLRGE